MRHLALFLPFLLAGVAEAQRLLLIDVDDVGEGILATAPTPNLDRIARNGLVLENFYSGPMCGPTRQRMNLGVYGNARELLFGSVVQRDGDVSLPLDPFEPLARVVANAGFTTAKIGKWHLAPDADVLHPNRAGWQHYTGVMGNPGPVHTGGTGTGTEGYYDFRLVTDGAVQQVVGRYLTTVETDQAIAVVRAGVHLVSVSYHAIHRPFHVPPPKLWSGPVPKTDKQKARAALHALDRELGRLVEAALEEGYTILVFSDNGTSSAIGGDKWTVWEGGVNVPCFAIGAGVPRGSVDALVGVEDVYATVLDLFSIPGAGGPTRGPDSVSFAPLLHGAVQPAPRPWAYSEAWDPNGVDPRIGPLLEPWRRCIRQERYKLMRDQGTPGERFFDLWADPGETTDLLVLGLSPGEQVVYDGLRQVLDGM